MGMFDTVWVTCPDCNGAFEQQTKDGPCELNVYYLPGEDVPVSILEGLRDRHESTCWTRDIPEYNMTCPDCGCEVTLELRGTIVGIPVKPKGNDHE